MSKKPLEGEMLTDKDLFPLPDPLARQTVKAMKFPVDALGPELSAMAKDLQLATEAPMAICCSSLLAAASLAAQAHVDVVVDGRVSPSSLYVMTIADSGERKTTVDNAVLIPHRSHEKKEWVAHLEKAQSVKIEAAIYNSQREAIIKDNGKYKTKEEKLIAIGLLSKPEELKRPYMIFEDATIEALIKRLSRDRPSVGLFSAEGGMFLTGHSMQKELMLRTIASLSKLWDGKAVDRDTISDFDDTIPLYGRRLAAHFMIQPRMAMQILGNTSMQSQGVLSRFLISWPDSTIGTRFGVRSVKMNQSVNAGTYYARMTKILEERLPIEDGKLGELKPRQLQLSMRAREIWGTFNNSIEKRMGKDGDLRMLVAFCNKSGEQAARIAAVLTLVDNVNATQIDGDQMRQAVSIMHYYVSEVSRVFCQGSVGDDLRHAQELLDWIYQQEGRKHVYPSMVYQYGPPLFRTREKAIKALETLETHGYLLKETNNTEVDGKKRKESWRVLGVEPEVHETQAEKEPEYDDDSGVPF